MGGGGGRGFFTLELQVFLLQLQTMHNGLTDWKMLLKITLYSECYIMTIVNLKICGKILSFWILLIDETCFVD